MTDKTDIELIKSFQAGDTASLGVLIDKYKKPLYAYIVSVVRSEETADDIFQEVFLKLVRNPAVYKEGGSFKSWLFTVSRNRCMDYFRSSGEEVSLDMEVCEGEMSLHDVVASDEKDPLDQLINCEYGDHISAALGALPPQQREVIILKQTMSFKEIAQMLGTPIGTVLARASRGYKAMQQHILSQNAQKEAAYARQ